MNTPPMIVLYKHWILDNIYYNNKDGIIKCIKYHNKYHEYYPDDFREYLQLLIDP